MTKRREVFWRRKKNIEEWKDETKEKNPYGYVQKLKNSAELKMKDKSSVYWGARLLVLVLILLKILSKK